MKNFFKNNKNTLFTLGWLTTIAVTILLSGLIVRSSLGASAASVPVGSDATPIETTEVENNEPAETTENGSSETTEDPSEGSTDVEEPVEPGENTESEEPAISLGELLAMANSYTTKTSLGVFTFSGYISSNNWATCVTMAEVENVENPKDILTNLWVEVSDPKEYEVGQYVTFTGEVFAHDRQTNSSSWIRYCTKMRP